MNLIIFLFLGLPTQQQPELAGIIPKELEGVSV